MGHMIATYKVWLSCDPHMGHMISPYKETIMPHLVVTLIYLSQNYSYHIRGDRSPLSQNFVYQHITTFRPISELETDLSLLT